MKYQFPQIDLTKAQRTWLDYLYHSFEQGRELELKGVRTALWNKLPRDFDPFKIDSRLLHNGFQITLLGVWHVNPDTDLIHKTNVPTGLSPSGLAVTPDSARVYVANSFSETVSVIDTATNTVVATVPLSGVPAAVAASPDGTRVYVTRADHLDVIDTATNTVIATIPTGGGPTGLAIAPDGTRAYTANIGSGTITVIDTATNTVVDTLTVGDNPLAIALSADGTRAYLTLPILNVVRVIDLTTGSLIATIPTGDSPINVAITPDGSRGYVTNNFGNSVTVFDTATNTVIETLTDRLSCPQGIAFTPGPTLPTSIDDCKNGGFRRFGGFRNQGECVSFVRSQSSRRH